MTAFIPEKRTIINAAVALEFLAHSARSPGTTDNIVIRRHCDAIRAAIVELSHLKKLRGKRKKAA